MKFLVTFILACSFFKVSAADHLLSMPFDTLMEKGGYSTLQILDKITLSKAYQMTYISVPLIIGGIIVKSEDDHFRQLRNNYLPAFNRHYDDYTQYLPAAVMLGLKAGGVKGRSPWERMLVSDAFSVVIMSTVVGQLKTKTKVMRPDGSNHHSFPSGHTATAFMTATLLSKEYGNRSPWYSIGGYSIAALTGLTRMTNNKHWLSDILAGAGIGILSAEFGYYLADLLFKEKGRIHFTDSKEFHISYKPSFIGIYLGLNVTWRDYNLKNNAQFSFSSGSTAGIEGALFFRPYIGIGGRFTATNLSVIYNNEASDESLDLTSISIGPYFSYPLTSRLLIGSKCLMGFVHYSSCHLQGTTIGGKNGFSIGTGSSITFRAKQNLGVKLFLDYNFFPAAIQSNKKSIQTITLGSAVSILF